MIALDVMGGDFSPNASLEGALGASKKNIPILLCGPEKTIISSLNALDQNWKSYPLEIYDAPEVIEMGDNPVQALSKKRRSSLVASIDHVKQGKASSCVSAGNSGAFMVAATLLLGKKKNIDRPAIGGFLPGLKSPVFCLDLGANSDCKPHYLLQFAELGLEYLQTISPSQKFRIGLLSNGTEETKGSALTKEAFKLLSSSSFSFVGNVEPYDVFTNKVDLVVCDGFSGNILLKTCEAMSDIVLQRISSELSKVADATMWNTPVENFLKSTIQPYFDWRTHGGALLLGVNSPVIVAHGASNAYALENALLLAWQTVSRSKNQKSFKPIQEVI